VILNHVQHKLFTLSDIRSFQTVSTNSVGGPEKAGVGGSIPSLATDLVNTLATAKIF